MKALAAALCGLLLAALPSTSALADTTEYVYTYTGNPFTTGPMAGESIDLSFPVAAPLGDNLSNANITPIQWSVSTASGMIMEAYEVTSSG